MQLIKSIKKEINKIRLLRIFIVLFLMFMLSSCSAAEGSEVILNNFRGKGAVFIQKDNTTLYAQNRTGFTTGPFFEEKFIIEIIDFSNNECNFTCSPDFSEFTDYAYKTIKENYSESEYIHSFKMIFEDGKWKLDNMVLAF